MLNDWRTAPIGEPLRATLGFLEKLTLTPEAIGPDDVRAVRAAGVSAQAIEDVIRICTLFCTITRIADSLGFDLPTPEGYRQGARTLLKRGYIL